MKITVTVVKGINTGKVRIFDNSAKAAKWADKMDLQYGAICTQKKYDFNA